MKFITKHILKTIALLAIVFSCSNNSEISQEQELKELNDLKNDIELLIAEGTCNENTNCDFIAFGSKPCGGPWSYLIFSTSINVDLLKEKVATYNQKESIYNNTWGIISDCMAVSQPTSIKCINGKCTAIY